MRGSRPVLVATASVIVLLSVAMAPAAAAAPDRSVCGGVIAYNEIPVGAGPGSSRLMAVPATGGTPRVVWDRPGAVQGELDPAWSADGRSIAFAGRSTDASGLLDSRLYVLRPGMAEPQELVIQLGQRGGLRFPTWSPDGTRLAYATGVPPQGADYKGLAWVHIVDVRTGQDTLLTGVPGALVTPDLDWSPRGDQILISALDPNNGHWTIFSARPDPTDPKLSVLISDDAGARASTGYPAFLPGGHAVLVEQDETDYLSSRLYLSDPRFQHLVPVTPRPGWETEPDFGASPLQAVYQQYNDDRSQTAISVVTLLTGQSRTLVPPVTGVYVEQPDWQPALGCRPWPFPSVN